MPGLVYFWMCVWTDCRPIAAEPFRSMWTMCKSSTVIDNHRNWLQGTSKDLKKLITSKLITANELFKVWISNQSEWSLTVFLFTTLSDYRSNQSDKSDQNKLRHLIGKQFSLQLLRSGFANRNSEFESSLIWKSPDIVNSVHLKLTVKNLSSDWQAPHLQDPSYS